ncbi:hypothetical protein OCU04_011312 [Sclerotinia nivalis]|uniref:Ubiquitin-like domain-containing protein n=1 Tax=Sclerotinia nivalis TaxID=352851 RepID=A0A9X0ACH7_9HELO|nr:hypothetical protein OCU04_011312 [Sclerotinia nivalis]
METSNDEYKFKNMAYNTFQSNDFHGARDDDSIFLAETYRPCKTLYISIITGTHTLLNLSPSSRISFVKATFISSLFNRRIIPHHVYECAFSYAGRELADDETLESCQIGDEATVNAVVWTVDSTLHKGIHQANEDASSKIGRDDEQKTRRSKRVRSALDLSDSDEDMEQSNSVLWRAPVSKKQKSVRFADEMDFVSYPPTPSHNPLTSKTSGPQEYVMSGGLGQGDTAIHFHDTLVRDSPRDDFPQRSSLEELPRPKSLKSALKSPPPFDIYTGLERFIGPEYDPLGNVIAQREISRRELHRNNDLWSNSNNIFPRKMEYGSSPTAVRFTPQNSNLQPLTSDPLPAVRNTVYIRPPGTRPISRTLSSTSFLGSLNAFCATTTPTPDPYQPLFCPPVEQTPSISSTSPHTSQTLFPSTQKTPSLSLASRSTPQTSFPLTQQTPLFKDPPLSHASSQPSRQPSSTLPPSDLYFSRQAPQSSLQSLNPYFSAPSLSSPSSRSPSTLQSLNPYFANTSPPAPKYPPSQPIHPHNSNSPQPTKQSPMTSDYFQAARRKATPSESKHHPLHSPLPPPPPPPHVRIEPPSPTHSPYAHRPPPADISDHLQAEPPSNTNSNDKPQSGAPTRQPPPPPLRRSPRLHTPSPSPPPSPQKLYNLPHLPLFYKYDTLPPSQPPPPPPQSSPPTPEPTPPLPSSEPTDPPPINPSKSSIKPNSNPTYYSPLHPLPKDFSLKGAIFIPSLAHEILPEDFLACRTVRQLIKLQGWEMSEREWWAVRKVLENCKKGEKGARGNMEVLVKGVVEIEGL